MKLLRTLFFAATAVGDLGPVSASAQAPRAWNQGDSLDSRVDIEMTGIVKR